MSSAHPDWEALAPAVLAGDDAAFAELLVKLHAYATRCAERATRGNGNELSPEDMASEVLFQLIKHVRNYDPSQGATFTTWCIIIIRTKIATQLRRHAKRRIPSAEMVTDPPARAEADPWDADDARYRVRRLLRPLPAKFRTIVLRHAAGETAADIARSMGVSPQYISQTIRDCHAKLRAAARAGKAGVRTWA